MDETQPIGECASMSACTWSLQNFIYLRPYIRTRFLIHILISKLLHDKHECERLGLIESRLESVQHLKRFTNSEPTANPLTTDDYIKYMADPGVHASSSR